MGWPLSLFMDLAIGFYLLSMTVEVAGFLVCLAGRRLSGWTILAASGFAGMFLAGVLVRSVTIPALQVPRDLIEPVYAVGAAIGFLSRAAVVFGLGMAFADFRRRLGLALEPPHAPR